MPRTPGGKIACGLVALALLALPGCGGDDGPAAAANAGSERVPAGASVTPDAVTPAVSTRRPSGRCGARLSGLLTALDRLRADLAVGANYDEYLAEVRRLQGAYERVPVGKASAVCVVAVGAPAERALNQYVEGVNAWGDCVAVADCDLGPVERELQRRWARAAELISAAQAGMSPGA